MINLATENIDILFYEYHRVLLSTGSHIFDSLLNLLDNIIGISTGHNNMIFYLCTTSI